jgi:hypothetical protein
MESRKEMQLSSSSSTERRNSRVTETKEVEETKEIEDLFKEQFPSHNEIEKRAYELYLERGEDGHAEENWIIAEKELKKKSAEGIAFLRLG